MIRHNGLPPRHAVNNTGRGAVSANNRSISYDVQVRRCVVAYTAAGVCCIYSNSLRSLHARQLTIPDGRADRRTLSRRCVSRSYLHPCLFVLLLTLCTVAAAAAAIELQTICCGRVGWIYRLAQKNGIIGQWRRRLECVVQQQGGHVAHLMQKLHDVIVTLDNN